jgi:hypothetical protein
MKDYRGRPRSSIDSSEGKLDSLDDLPPVILPPQDPADPSFYILSTEWGVGPSSDPSVTILTADTDEDNFVSALESASLALESTPAAPPETSLGIPLGEGDYWLCWMQTNYFQATNIYVQAVQTVPQQYSIQGYAVTLSLVPPPTPGSHALPVDVYVGCGAEGFPP